jgi:hypothetical protein
MKIRWALFSAAILIGFLPSQVTSEEAVLGQGNISCGSWIENRRDDNPLAATRTAWVTVSFPKIISGRNGGTARTRLGWRQWHRSAGPPPQGRVFAQR